jgi:hypothetical protein
LPAASTWARRRPSSSRRSYARPGEAHFITDDDLSTADLDRLAAVRRAIVEGTASPSDVAAAEREATDLHRVMDEAIERWIDAVFEHYGEPIFLYAGHAMLWRILEGGRRRGVPDGGMHPDSVIRTGGGMKGFMGQGDFYGDVERFFGIDRRRWVYLYGMSGSSPSSSAALRAATTFLQRRSRSCSTRRATCSRTVPPALRRGAAASLT